MKSQTAFHGTTHRVVLNTIAEMVVETASVALGDDLDANYPIGCQQNLAQLVIEFQMIGSTLEKAIGRFQHFSRSLSRKMFLGGARPIPL
jgi:hypothetical protein